MRILVQKFGGTSVADIDRLKMVRGKVKAALDQGYKVVVVLSAKSGKTNKLLDLSTRWAAEPDLAEVDSLLSTGEQASIALFSMLLKDSGIKARSMLGWQIPIITNDEFGRARILSIDASRIHKELEAHDVLVDMFVAVGGGSPMDASKAISMLAKNGIVCENAEFSESESVVKAEKCELSDSIAKVEELLYTPAKLPFYPIVCVPTTCGTGSEATPYSILTSHIKQTKKSIAHKIFPSLALVDYSYLKTSSYGGMKSTCVDALAHMIESRLNTNANAFSRAYAEEGMRLWASCKGCLETEGRFAHMTDDEFSTFMQASVLAGMAIAYTGTSIPHGLSYTLTYENGVPHGKAVGVFLSGFLKKYGDSTEAEYAVKQLLDFDDLDAFRNYIRTLFGKLDMSEELWKKDRDGILANPAKLKNYPFKLTADVLDDYVRYYNS